jgi:hypothetical protein
LSASDYFQLDGSRILQTATVLHSRIEERFPGFSLANAAGQIEASVRATSGRIASLSEPHWPLRITSMCLLVLTVLFLGYGLFGAVDWGGGDGSLTFTDFVALLEPSLGSSVFVGAFFVFVTSIERRWKHQRVLTAISELRSFIHVVDMHQLTKDPERIRHHGPNTESSPTRRLTTFELGRYLEYCSEMLSTISKVAALYAQAFPDPVILTAADQVETLATGMSQKIWQKLVLLGNADES